VLFSEPGLDSYWSPDGTKLIFVSNIDPKNLAIYDMATHSVTRNVAPRDLGDYPSWGKVDGRDVVVTINGNYYFLNNGKAETPYRELSACQELGGSGDRPLISKATGRLTVFSKGVVAVRNLRDCRDIGTTNLPGAKADFSYDGRFIALHVPKEEGTPGYAIKVFDIENRLIIPVTALRGTSLFPSWTNNGDLVFRYEDGDQRGFMRASGFLSNRAEAIPGVSVRNDQPRWNDVFPSTPAPITRAAVVIVWANWGAHSVEALSNAQSAWAAMRSKGLDVSLLSAIEPSTNLSAAREVLREYALTIPILELAAGRLNLTGAQNQIPTALVFDRGVLVAQRLGAQSVESLTRAVQALVPVN
jgi:hypothetical protein